LKVNKEKFETILFLLKLKGFKCEFLEKRLCSTVGIPCCIFCKHLEECYEESRYFPVNQVICKLSRGISFCEIIRDKIKKLEMEIRNEERFPCCLFCQYLKECYSKSEFKKLHEISCKYDKKVYFCIRVRDELQKLIEGGRNE